MKYIKNDFIDHQDPVYTKGKTASAPDGFEAYFIKTKKWYQCTNHNSRNDQCTIHISADRWSRLTEEEKCQVSLHNHQYPQIDAFFSLQINENSNKSPVQNTNQPKLTNIDKRLVVLIGKKNISINCAASSLFTNLIKESIKEGQKRTFEPIEKIYHPQSRTTLTKKLVSSASIIFNYEINKLIPYKYVGVSIDAGKINSTPYFNAVISNSLVDEKPIALKTFENFSGTKKAYMDAISQIIDQVNNLNLTISGFVADNLRVQWSALNDAVKSHKELYNVSCGCHSLNLAINDMKKYNFRFFDHYQNLINFTHIFISKPVVSQLHLVCPRICETRWTNIADICIWIMTHLHIIFKFVAFNESRIDLIKENIELIRDVLFESAPTLLLILISFKELSLVLERNRTSMSELYAWELLSMIHAREITKGLYTVYNFVMSLEGFIRKRLEHSKSATLQYLLLTLTAKGRIIDKLLRRENQIKLDDFIISNYSMSFDRYTDIIELSKSIIKTNEILNIKKTNFVDSIKNGTIQFDDDDNKEEFGEPDMENEESYEKYTDSDFTEEEYSDDIYMYDFALEQNYCLDELETICNKLNYEKKTVINAYFKWLTNPNFDVFSNSDTDTYSMWEFIGRNKEFEQLADIALRYASIPASESSCERLFSIQRETMDGKRSRTSVEVASARHTIMNSDESIINKALNIQDF